MFTLVRNVTHRVVHWTFLSIIVAVAAVAALVFAHVVSADSWMYRNPHFAAFSGTILVLLLSVAMSEFRLTHRRTRGAFELAAGCLPAWNAILVATQQGQPLQFEGIWHAEFLLKILLSVFLMLEAHKDRHRAAMNS
jgi:uncharacterized membrane protein